MQLFTVANDVSERKAHDTLLKDVIDATLLTTHVIGEVLQRFACHISSAPLDESTFSTRVQLSAAKQFRWIN